MRPILLLFFSLISLSSSAFDVYFKHHVFYNTDKGSYVETHMLFNAETFSFSDAEGGYQSNIALTYIFNQNGVVKDWSKTQVNSPITQDTLNQLQDFFDLQRFYLPNGEYQLTIKVVDLNNPQDTSLNVLPVTVETPVNEGFFSDVMYVLEMNESDRETMFTRSGFEMIPRISGFFGPSDTTLKFYTEIYHADKAVGNDELYILSINILNDKGEPVVGTFKRMRASEVEAVYNEIDIAKLPTGNYSLDLAVKSRANKVVAHHNREFTRYSLYQHSDTVSLDEISGSFVFDMAGDSLKEISMCLRSRLNRNEVSLLDASIKKDEVDQLRKFVYVYFSELSNLNPESEYLVFEKDMQFVKKEFNVKNMHGCITDRGRIYMKYGKPNTRVVQISEPNSRPYEIWHYYKIPEKSDAKFAFIDKTLITNYYVLLHSNVNGEIKDYQWYTKLNNSESAPLGADNPMTVTGDAINVENLTGVQLSDVGARALEYWNNPR